MVSKLEVEWLCLVFIQGYRSFKRLLYMTVVHGLVVPCIHPRPWWFQKVTLYDNSAWTGFFVREKESADSFKSKPPSHRLKTQESVSIKTRGANVYRSIQLTEVFDSQKSGYGTYFLIQEKIESRSNPCMFQLKNLNTKRITPRY